MQLAMPQINTKDQKFTQTIVKKQSFYSQLKYVQYLTQNTKITK